ncbi:MAG: PorP/SprF family type IX secretion system membrane protein [Bacteroidales bacterium]|nr:PorP/SprF family type IX secretion system membrane protein [Bacteroidales bacterium]
MKNLARNIIIAVAITMVATPSVAQDASFSQTYEAPLYLSPSFTGLTNGTRIGANYRNQWPGIGNVYQNYSIFADHFFDQFNSGLGVLWLCDNMGKGLVVDNEFALLYSYEVPINSYLFLRPGISFKFGERKIDRSKMVSYTDITADGQYQPGGSSIDIENTRAARFDAGASIMAYNEDFWFGLAFDHLVQPDVSFTDQKNELGIKFTAYAGYKLTYEPSYRGSEPKTVTFGVNYKHQYSFNQLEIGAYWYYNPIELGLMYRGLFFQAAQEISNVDAVVPSIGINIFSFRLGYSYDISVSELSGFGKGAHEVSLIYRIIPDNVRHKSYKMKPVPCSEPIMGYSYSGKGMQHRKTYKRRFFRR